MHELHLSKPLFLKPSCPLPEKVIKTVKPSFSLTLSFDVQRPILMRPIFTARRAECHPYNSQWLL